MIQKEFEKPIIEVQKRWNEISKPIIEAQKRWDEINKPIIEAQKRWDEINKPIIEAQKRWNEINKPIIEAQKRWNEINKPIIDAHKAWQQQMRPIIDAQNIFREQLQTIIDLHSNIDWSVMRKTVAEHIKEFEDVLVEHENHFWCLDMDIVTDIVDSEITVIDLPEYVDEKLELYVTEIVQDPMYELHATLIQEAYEAYKVGFYKLCVMPLFAALEHVVAMWYLGYIKEEMILVNQYPNIGGLKYKINPDKFNHVEIENFNRIFAFSVFRTYRKLFDDIPDQLSQKLNRNAISHGYYDYDSISKVDILKLFQILKSAMILKSFDRNKVAES
ncbi:hypothetical protein BKL48_12675 [Bacillus cereus]|nr:hypothetical protein BKL48_12675 [Bacillus cereus]